MSERFSHSNNKILLTSVKYYRDFSKNNSTNNHHIGLNLPYDHMYASNNDDELFIGGSSDEQRITTPPTQSDSCRQSVTDKCDCENEVKFLKEFLLMHLDLIQQQNEDILAKESTIVFLQQENDLLKERLSCMERSNSNPKTTTNEMTQGTTVDVQEDSLLASLPTTVTTDQHNSTTDEIDVLPHNFIVEQQQLTTVVSDNLPTDLVVSDNKDSVVLAESMTTEKSHNNITSSETVINNSDTETTTMKNVSLRRKRACSSSSLVSSHNDESSSSLLLCEEKVRVNYYATQSRKKKRKQAAVMTSQCEYVTRVGEQQVSVSSLLLQSHSDRRHHHRHHHDAVVTKAAASAAAAAMASLEVPHWRVKVYTDSSQLEGTENTEDDVYSKRHARPEGDERRRKRWDAQRLREQRLLDKLRQRRHDGDKYHQRGGVMPASAGEGGGGPAGEQPNHLQQQQLDCHLRGDGTTTVTTSCVTTTTATNNTTTNSSSEGNGDTDVAHATLRDSFWPASQRDLHFIEMTDELPVAAFGAALPALRHSEFSLPWLKIATAAAAAAASYPLASQLRAAADTYRKSSITTRSKKSI